MWITIIIYSYNYAKINCYILIIIAIVLIAGVIYAKKSQFELYTPEPTGHMDKTLRKGYPLFNLYGGKDKDPNNLGWTCSGTKLLDSSMTKGMTDKIKLKVNNQKYSDSLMGLLAD